MRLNFYGFDRGLEPQPPRRLRLAHPSELQRGALHRGEGRSGRRGRPAVTRGAILASMASPAALHQYSFADYLALEEASNTKHEFLDGEIYAMAGGSRRHAALAVAAAASLLVQLRGGPCRVYSSDLRVRAVPSGLTTYPDVTVVCGPDQVDPRAPRRSPTRGSSSRSPPGAPKPMTEARSSITIGGFPRCRRWSCSPIACPRSRSGNAGLTERGDLESPVPAPSQRSRLCPSA